MLSYKYYSTADVVGFSIAINCLYAPQNEVPIWRGLTSIDPKEKLLAAKCTNDLYLPSSRRHLQSIRLSFYTLFSYMIKIHTYRLFSNRKWSFPLQLSKLTFWKVSWVVIQGKGVSLFKCRYEREKVVSSFVWSDNHFFTVVDNLDWIQGGERLLTLMTNAKAPLRNA